MKVIDPSTLYIRHLPSELNLADREELLKLAGAIKVTVMPDNHRMKYSAFASFKNHNDAKQAISLLHQKEILGRHLIVEFAKEQHQTLVPHTTDFPKFVNHATKETSVKVSDKEVLRLDMEDFSRKLHGIAPALSLDYLPSPLLKYKYPPPTPTIIQNISHALASVPKFYTQVLHLMNKMNLPAPFGPLTPAPPLSVDQIYSVQEPVELNNLQEENMVTTEEESEYESEGEKEENKTTEIGLPQKRHQQKLTSKRKKCKLVNFIPTNLSVSNKEPTEPSEVFESCAISQKKIVVKKIEPIALSSSSNIEKESVGGFGAFDGSKTISDKDDESKADNLKTGDVWHASQFISWEELKKKRISSREMKTMSIFRNYSPGEPTFRLYIKNLAKQVDEKDLRYIFGKFIDRTSESERNMFDIRLMKEGRMKGQAFVTLANEKQAIEAVKEINGFVLHTKPLVVQFARSAKPKKED